MKNGYTIKQMLIVIIILGIFTLGLFATTSNAYKDSSNDYYADKILVIEKQAELYAETLPELKETGNTVITVNDLVEANYYVADKNGDVIDPRNDKATLNSLKIKLSYDNGKYKAKVIED